MRKQLSFCISKLKGGDTLVINGMGHQIPRVVKMAEILKERIGWLHQVTNFTTRTFEKENNNGKPMREVGIVITLSKKTLPNKDVGYQKPKQTKASFFSKVCLAFILNRH